jgi:hypothetical protein
MKRAFTPIAVLGTVALLGACEAPTMSDTSMAVPGSGSENCLEAIKTRAGTSTILGSNTSVGGSGTTTVIAETAGGENWTCIAAPDGSVRSVEQHNQSVR